jgi:hypothetical protein
MCAKSWQTPRASARASAAVVWTFVDPRSYIIASRTACRSCIAVSEGSTAEGTDAASSVRLPSAGTYRDGAR